MLYVCVKNVMDVVFSGCIVTRGAVGVRAGCIVTRRAVGARAGCIVTRRAVCARVWEIQVGLAIFMYITQQCNFSHHFIKITKMDICKFLQV